MVGRSADPHNYFLLNEPLHSDYVHTLLGRVVEKPSEPIYNFVPVRTLDLDDLVDEKIYESPAIFADVDKVISRAMQKRAQVKMMKILELFAEKSGKSVTEISAPCFRRYKMSQIPQKFQQLMENKVYKNSVEDLFRENHNEPLGFVVGLLTCCDMTINKSTGEAENAGTQAGIPQEAVMAAGGPPGITVEALVHGSKSSHGHSSGTGQGEMVVALSYHKLCIKKPKRSWWSFWRKTENSVIEIEMSSTPMRGDLPGFFSKDSNGSRAGSSDNSLETEVASMSEAKSYDFKLYYEPDELS